MSHSKSLYLLVALTLLLPGCFSIHSYRKADPHQITHHTWWNYYQRGRLYLHEENHTKAKADFETALGLIPGARAPYAQDRWKVRTYGMHMLEGYFPHRELGICLYRMNQPKEALKLLETSISMEPSARAKFYINRIREDLAAEAAPPPDLRITAIPKWSMQKEITVQGTITCSNEITDIEINQTPIFIELAKKQIEFKKVLPLHEGENQLKMFAIDISGKQISTNLIVTADWTPPQIHLQRNGTNLKIICTDNTKLNLVQINNQAFSIYGKEYQHSIPLQNDSLLISVSDQAGNSTDWELTSKEVSHLLKNTTPRAPQLKIKNAGKTLVQIAPEYELDIQADDDTALKRLELNGENILTRTTPIFRTAYRIPLTQGTNQLKLVATDFDENCVTQSINIIYRTPEYLDNAFRLTTLQSPLSGEVLDANFAQRVEYLMGNNLTSAPIRFFLLASSKEVPHLTAEQSLSSSELADPRVMLKEGKTLNADLLFISRVLNDDPGQTIYTQVLDARSAEELFIEDIYVEEPEQLPRQLEGLVMKIEQHFPLLKGSVRNTGNKLIINTGETLGAITGMKLLVIRSEGAFEQGHVLMRKKRPIELVISEVESESATVIFQKHSENIVQEGDYVFSR